MFEGLTMDPKLIRHILDIANRAPMSPYERYCFNQHAQLILVECENAEQKAKESKPTGPEHTQPEP